MARKPDRIASSLDVATWNIHGGRGVDNRYAFSRVVDLIDRRDPDVIGLQEVDRRFRSASGFEDQLDILATELDMQARFGANLVREPAGVPGDGRGEYGVAVLCKHEYPIRSTEHYSLPSHEVDGESPEPRGLLEVEIDVGGGTLFFYNTHLTLFDGLRPRQVAALLEITDRQPDPQVLVGDFNATPDARAIELVRQQFDDAAIGSECAGQATRPPEVAARRIDYVFVTSGVDSLEYTVVDEVASDHLLVEATLSDFPWTTGH